jgi:hypothetical protein
MFIVLPCTYKICTIPAQANLQLRWKAVEVLAGQLMSAEFTENYKVSSH